MVDFVPFAQEFRELVLKFVLLVDGSEKVHVQPVVLQGAFANQQNAGIEKIADDRPPGINHPVVHDQLEFRQYLGQLENAVGVINLEDDRIPVEPQERGPDLGPLAVAA
jgi:hypothetical protein